ncbi:hypothetical protein Tco_0514067 [Tanacetum coccineum]
MSASGMISLWVGDGRSNVGDGILGNGDYRGDNGDGGGDGGVGAAAYSVMRALMDACKGGWGRTVFHALRRPVWDKGTIVCGEEGGGGVAIVSSVSNGYVSSYEGTKSGTSDAGSFSESSSIGSESAMKPDGAKYSGYSGAGIGESGARSGDCGAASIASGLD